MQTLLVGGLIGLVLGVIIGFYVAEFSVAVRATAAGLGAGIGIFAVGALLRYVADRTDKVFGRIKEGKEA